MTYLKNEKGSDLTLFFSMAQSNLAAATLSKVFSLAPSICLQIVTPLYTYSVHPTLKITMWLTLRKVNTTTAMEVFHLVATNEKPIFFIKAPAKGFLYLQHLPKTEKH